MLSLYLYVLYDIYDICGYIWAGLLLPDGSLGSFRRRWTRCRKLRRPMCRCFSTLARTCSAVAAQCIRKIMDGGWIIMIMKYHTHHINIYINGYHIPWQWKKPFWSWAVETCWNSEHFRWCFKYVQIFQQFYTVLTYCNRLVSGLHMSPIVPSSHRPVASRFFRATVRSRRMRGSIRLWDSQVMPKDPKDPKVETSHMNVA